MSDRQKELRDLAKADQDIADGEQRLAEQIALLRQLAERGEDTVEAEKLVRTFEDTLKAFRAHRALIVEAVKRK